MSIKSLPSINFSAIASDGENGEEVDALLMAGLEVRKPKEDWGP